MTAPYAVPNARRLALPSYVAAFSLMVFPVFDQAMQLVPTLKLHDARWRYGALGLLSNMLLLPVVSVMIVLLMANAFDHRKLQRFMSILCGVATIGIVVLIGVFSLDAIQVRGQMNPRMLSSWAVASSTAGIKFVVAGTILGLFAVAAWRNSRPSRAASARRSSSASLLVGSTRSKAIDAGAADGSAQAERPE